MVWADLKALIALSYCRNKNEVIEAIFDCKKTQNEYIILLSSKYTEILKVEEIFIVVSN
jgi:phosphoheptose isomerase